MANNREKYIASKAYKRPVGSFTQRDDIREFAGSGPGRNLFSIQELQRQAPTFEKDDSRIDELKKRRRLWNRYQKYPAGEMLGKTPQQMQNEYMGLSRDLRQTAKPAYNKMYPLTGGFMDYADKGGMWGSILSGLARKTLKKGKDYLDDLGVASLAAGDTKEDKERYITETFGPHREDIEELDFTDEYEGPRPHDERSLMSDEQAAWLREMNQNPYYQNLLDPNVVLPFEKERRGHPHMETYTPDAGPILGTASPHDPSEGIRVAPWLTDPSLPMPEELIEEDFFGETIEEDLPPIIPFDDSNREEAIRRNMMPDQKSDKDHPLWDEYWNFLIDEGDSYDFVQGGPPSFEEYKDSRGRIYKGKPHALHSSYR